MSSPPVDAPLRERPVFHPRGFNPRPIYLVGPSWAPRFLVNNMAVAFRGIEHRGAPRDFRGVSWFLLPAPAPSDSCSAHFRPDSPYFQSFVGVYILPPIEGERAPLEIWHELGRRDDLAWLRHMGDPAPRCTTEIVRMPERIATNPDGENVFGCQVRYRTHTDLGAHNRRAGLPALATPPEPSAWENVIGSYQDITQHCEARAFYQRDYLIISYFTGVSFVDRVGREIDTLAQNPALRAEMARMAAGVRILDDGSPYACPPPREALEEER